MAAPSTTPKTWPSQIQSDGRAHSAQPIDVTGPTAPVISVDTATSAGFTARLTTPSSDIQSGVLNYILEIATASGGPYTTVAQIVSGLFPYSVLGLTSSTTYYMRSRGVDASSNANQSPNSGVVSITTLSGSNTTFNPSFPRMCAFTNTGAPRQYDDNNFITWASKFPLVVTATWDGWQSGRSKSMKTVYGNIKSSSPLPVPPLCFAYVDPNHYALSGSTIQTILNTNKFWLYDSYPSGTISKYGGSTSYGDYNLTTGGPTLAGRNGMQYMADYWWDILVGGGSLGLATVTSGLFETNSNCDGVFEDDFNTHSRIAADYNRDGVAEPLGTPATDQAFRDSQVAWVNRWKLNSPTHYLLANIAPIKNSSAVTTGETNTYHGGSLEGALGSSWSMETGNGWVEAMKSYERQMAFLIAPKLGIFFQTNLSYDGRDFYRTTPYQGSRYGITMCLLGDAYYYASCIGNGALSNGSGVYDLNIRAWFDEFSVNPTTAAALAYPAVDSGLGYLGFPIDNDAYNRTAWQAGVMRRRFRNPNTGKEWWVFNNPKGNGLKTINLGQSMKKILGILETTVNSGATVSSVTIPDSDGIILMVP